MVRRPSFAGLDGNGAWRRACTRILGGVALAATVTLAATRPAAAQIGTDHYGAIVIDAASGNVLQQYSPDAALHPASLTKMMTLYMLFEALRDRRLSLNSPIPFSVHAASMIPTKLGLPAGNVITVEDAILGMVTLSANDAAAAVGERLGGDEDSFAQMMTLRARALGMTHTVFRNASGLPDPDQVSSARDMAILARHLIQDFPNEYHYFATPSFVFRGRVILNHDSLLRLYPGADGMKTGFINGTHNLVTSALRGDVRLIGVVLGAASNGERDVDMMSQLDRGFVAEGVPVEPRAPQRLAGVGLIASAHAAGLPPALRPQLKAAQVRLAAAGAVMHPLSRRLHPAEFKAIAPALIPSPIAPVSRPAARGRSVPVAPTASVTKAALETAAIGKASCRPDPVHHLVCTHTTLAHR